MNDIKEKCLCLKEIVNLKEIPKNFKYVGCDDQNNPVFKCKDCNCLVYG